MNLFPFKLARKYVFSGKNAIEVNVISWIAFLALGFVTACLFIIMSVFTGLESVNLQFYSNINPEIAISPAKGKTIQSSAAFEEKLNEILAFEEVETLSKFIEERAFIRYNNKNHIVTLKGIDENFNQIFRLDTMVRIGDPLGREYLDEIVIGTEVSSRLSLFTDPDLPVQLYVPKPGKGLISNEEDAVNKVMAFSSGIFFINDKFANYVFSNIELAQALLNYNEGQFSGIEIKANTADLNKLKRKVQNIVGDDYQVKTRQEIDAAFLKMMNTENLIIYLICFLILIIASFNLAGSIAILILDKAPESRTLHSMGFNNTSLRKTYFYTGMLITLYALIFGLLVGSFFAWMQHEFSLVMVSFNVPFPVKFTVQNYLITIISVMGIGLFVSWFVSRNAKIKEQAH